MEKINVQQILKETSESVTNGHTIEQLEEFRTLLKKVDKEGKKSLKHAIKILEEVIRLKKKKGNSPLEKIYISLAFILLIGLLGGVYAMEPPMREGYSYLFNLSNGHGHFGRLLVGNLSYLDLEHEFHVLGNSHLIGDLNVTGDYYGNGSQLNGLTESQITDLQNYLVQGTAIDVPEIYNSVGDLKIMPDVQGDVVLFGDTQVGDSTDGRELKIYRKAVEGNSYIRFYIVKGDNAMIHSDETILIQNADGKNIQMNSGQHIYLNLGDQAGSDEVRIRDSGGLEIMTIDSNGNTWSRGDVSIGVSSDVLIQANGDTYFNGGNFAINTSDFFVDVSSGNVGIGVSDPTTPLSIMGNGGNNEVGITQNQVGGTNTMELTTKDGEGNQATRLLFRGGSNDSDTEFSRGGRGGETVSMFIEGSNGFVGIGTTAPALPLEVRNNDDNLALFVDSRAQAQGTGGGIAFAGKYNDAGGEAMAGRIGTQKTNGISGNVSFDMVFETQDWEGSITERMILTGDGKVGIGEESPTKTLDVGGDVHISGELETDNGIIANGNIEAKSNIDVDGYIGIGDPTPNFMIDAYEVRSSGIKRSARFWMDGNHVDARGLYVIAGEDTESGTNYWFEAYDGDGGINTGVLRSVSGVFAVYDASDRRLKQNIEDTNISGENIIKSLQVRDFEWKNGSGQKVTGFIAQEVLKVYPDAIGDPDPESGMYSISNTILIPILVKHNQELDERVSKLEENQNLLRMGVCN